MKRIILCLLFVSGVMASHAQKKPVEEITKVITKHDAEAHLTFWLPMKCAAAILDHLKLILQLIISHLISNN